MIVDDNSGWSTEEITTCGDKTAIGGPGILGKNSVLEKTFEIDEIYVGCMLSPRFIFVKFDKWDNEVKFT